MSKKVIVIGGHGRMAQAATFLLVDDGCEVTSAICNSDQVPDIEVSGATPVAYDTTNLSTEQFADLLSGHDVMIWSAGAGGGSPERTYVIDHDAAITSITAAEQAGVKRYVMVSYFGAGHDHSVSGNHSFFAYTESRATADEALCASNLEWAVLGPSTPTLDKGQDSTDTMMDKAGKVARVIVANVIAQTVFNETTVGRTINFNEGNTPIAEALKEQGKETGDGTPSPSFLYSCLCSYHFSSTSS